MTLRRNYEQIVVRAAFTLMEMLVVVAIIVALAGLGTYYFLGTQKDAQKNVARAKMATLNEACAAYYLRHNSFPQNLQMLLVADEQGNQPLLKRAEALVDPWGNAFQYDPSGQHNGGRDPDIWCVAPDGVQLGNWMSMVAHK